MTFVCFCKKNWSSFHKGIKEYSITRPIPSHFLALTISLMYDGISYFGRVVSLTLFGFDKLLLLQQGRRLIDVYLCSVHTHEEGSCAPPVLCHVCPHSDYE